MRIGSISSRIRLSNEVLISSWSSAEDEVGDTLVTISLKKTVSTI